MILKEMTGLAFLQAMQKGALPYPAMWDTMNIKIADVSTGEIKFIVMADDRHTNSQGGVHGGFSETVMDSVTGCAIHTMLEKGVGFATTDLTVKMVRPIPENVELSAIGKVINLSKNLGVSEGRIVDESSKLYVHATASCFILNR
ncbi:MAG: PaaI family thioesterase [Desulfobacterales bacterium]|nr:PaaI family thioesterase [Desulfobacterales bacterium]